MASPAVLGATLAVPFFLVVASGVLDDLVGGGDKKFFVAQGLGGGGHFATCR